MSSASPSAPARALFAARPNAALTESPSHKERRLFLGGKDDDQTHNHHHAGSPASSPRNLQRLAALQHARRTSKDFASTSAAVLPQEPFVLSNKDEPAAQEDKSEDGQTVVLGEAKVQGSPLLITQTLPGSSPPVDHTVSPRNAVRRTSSGSQHFHPGVDMNHLDADLTNRPQQPQQQQAQPQLNTTGTSAVIAAPVVEEDKLVPPPVELVAPLDTMRPEPSDNAAAAASSSAHSSGAAADALQQTGQPHALDSWSSISSQLREGKKQIVVFLDYDGTLTPIVSEPSAAIITPNQRARLAALASKYPVSIVTGRKVDTIKEFILGSNGNLPSLAGLEKIHFAGSHGFDIFCPSDASGSRRVAEEYLPLLKEFHAQCEKECASIPGAFAEDNTFSISIHYRNVSSEADVAKVEDIVTRALQPFEKPDAKLQLQRHRGKMVHEIRPKIDWHKGAAVDYLLKLIFPSLAERKAGEQGALPRLQDGTEIVPVYVGDDTTDEDAFRLLRKYSHGEAGHAISVFVRTDDKARPSAANYVVRDPNEVGELLTRLAKL